MIWRDTIPKFVRFVMALRNIIDSFVNLSVFIVEQVRKIFIHLNFGRRKRRMLTGQMLRKVGFDKTNIFEGK